MADENHYLDTKQFFRESALERKGYYDLPDTLAFKIQRFVRSQVLNLVKRSHNSGTISDIGCGRGDFSEILSKKFPEARVWGVDFSDETLQLAKRRLADDSKISFAHGNLINIPFEDRFFDTTICLNTLHHVHKKDMHRAIKELARITRYDIVLEIKNSGCLANFALERINAFQLPINVYKTSVKEIKKILKGQFRVREMKPLFVLGMISPIVVLRFSRI